MKNNLRLLLLVSFLFQFNLTMGQFRGGLEGFTTLDLKIGYAIPMGSFGGTGTGAKTGYALPGFNGSAGVYHFLHDWIGFGGSLGIGINGYDEDARTRTIFKTNPEVTEAVVRASRYTTLTFCGGIKIQKRFSESFSFNIKGEIGLLLTLRPEQYLYARWLDDENEIILDRFGGTSMCLLGGTSFHYNASETFSLALYGDLTYGNPAIEFVTYQAPEWFEISGKLNVVILNVGLQSSIIIGY